MTIKQCIREYSSFLKEVTHIPAKEVEILIMHLLNKNVIWLHLNAHETFLKEAELKNLIKKRAKFYPLEYLTNQASFYGENFIVKENVLIPRPETEILVEKAYEVLKNIKKPKLIEVGVGSGIISVMLCKLIKDLEVIAIDINEDALSLALQNAKKHEVQDRITLIKGDLLTNTPNTFDMCISNPPYIKDDYVLPHNVKYEPKNALFSGSNGDELLKELIDQTSKKDIQYLYCEFGFDQKNSIQDFAKNYAIKSLEFYKDYSDFDRGFLIEFKR